MSPVYKVNIQLFKRYQKLLEAVTPDDPNGSDYYDSAQHLIKLCRDMAVNTNIDSMEHSRWIGYIQGVISVMGLIDISTEAHYAQTLFDNATHQGH